MLSSDELQEKYPELARYSDPVSTPERKIVGREDEIRRIRAGMQRPELPNILLLAAAGTGKALADGTLVPVVPSDPSGPRWKAIEDVVPGDLVASASGAGTRVLGTFPQGLRTMYRMRLRDGRSLDVDGQHLHEVVDLVTGEARTMTTEHMLEAGLSVGHGPSLGEDRFSLPVGGPVAWPEAETRVVPYAAGLVLGSMVPAIGGGRGSLAIHEDLPQGLLAHIAEEVSEHVEQSVLEPRHFIASKPGLTPLYAAFGVLSQKALLASYQDGSPQQRGALLQGFADAAEHTGADWSLVRDLFFSLGGRAAGSVMDQAAANGLVLDTRVRSIERYEDQRSATCIYVEDERHLFQAGQFVLTHNTALVQAVMMQDEDRTYLEVDPARMIADLDSMEKLGARLKALFDDASRYVEAEGRELVIFIDEFHQLIQTHAGSVEALKPVLAASGTKGLRIIAATTNEEFHQHVAPNQPLVERLQRINVPEPDTQTTVEILKGMAARYDVADMMPDDRVYNAIVEYTNRYNPSGSQPRKSILLLDGMVGWHRETKRPMNKALLAEVLHESTGINVAFKVDAGQIQEELDKHVLAQQMATRTLADRLQINVADLQDKTKPSASFLFSGSTGVGKTELTKQLARLLFGDARKHLIRFDMSEYSQPESIASFRSQLTRSVWNMGHSIILLDEIEKAHRDLTRLLLQVLDDGRLSDDNGRQVSFLNSYIVMTTNAGSEVFDTVAHYASSEDGDGSALRDFMRVIRKSITETTDSFPPELLGRVDALVPFQPLHLETKRAIVRGKLLKLVQEARLRHGVRVAVDEDVLKYLVDEDSDVSASAGGARTAVAKLTGEVTSALARFINEHPQEKNLRIDIDGEMASGDKNLRVGTAHVVVSARA